jgi:UDP-N-acetylmuramate--alanine ligase
MSKDVSFMHNGTRYYFYVHNTTAIAYNVERKEKIAEYDRMLPDTFLGYERKNAALALAAAEYLQIDLKSAAAALQSYPGIQRRQNELYCSPDKTVVVVEDYAHHPTEIEATIRSAKEIAKNEVWCVFQSHTYSRTAELYDGFISALSLADRVITLDIYSARETDTLGVSGERMAEDVGDKAIYANSFKSAAIHLIENAKAGDLVLVMGAGDVFHVFDYLNLNK